MIKIDPAVFSFVAKNPKATQSLVNTLAFIDKMESDGKLNAKSALHLVTPIYAPGNTRLFQQGKPPEVLMGLIGFQIEHDKGFKLHSLFVRMGATSDADIFPTLAAMRGDPEFAE